MTTYSEIYAAVDVARASFDAIDTFSVHCAESNGDDPTPAVAALNAAQWAFHDALCLARRLATSVPVGCGNIDDATEGAAIWALAALESLTEEDIFA